MSGDTECTHSLHQRDCEDVNDFLDIVNFGSPLQNNVNSEADPNIEDQSVVRGLQYEAEVKGDERIESERDKKSQGGECKKEENEGVILHASKGNDAEEEKEIVTPYLLSDEDIVSRGVLQCNTEMYR